MSKKLLLEANVVGDDRSLKFYDDGTYLRSCGDVSYWKYDEYIYIRHSYSSRWLILDEHCGDSDRLVAAKLIEAIHTELVEKELLREEE